MTDSPHALHRRHREFLGPLDLAVGIVRGVARAVPHDAPGWADLAAAAHAVEEARDVMRETVALGPCVGGRFAHPSEQQRYGATHVRYYDVTEDGGGQDG